MEVRGPVMWMFLMSCIFGHIITSHNNVFVEAKSFSKFEDLEIEKRLKSINKPAVKIIKSIDGERYGCVDFFKQPAFDHPSMQNHTYHYKMRPIWKGMRERKTNNTGFGYLWENGVGCPIGTVPIQRVTKDDLLRLDSFGDNHKPRGSWNTTTDNSNSVLHNDKHHFAVARSLDPTQRFNGATMELCITAPKVKPTQFSASRLHIQIGKDFIQTGFTVNPALYKDSQPRTFVYTNSGGKSCYNSNCDVGMLLVRQDFPLGTALLPVSIRGAKISHYGIFGLIKDEKNGNWWLQFGDNAEEVGFWPSSRFHQSSGNYVEWGGEVYSASLPSPEMGYGHYPVEDMRYDAYIKRITVLDGFNYIDRRVAYLEEFADNDRGYTVIDDYSTHKYPKAGHIIFFGGPGNI
ncbi:Neprosin activation peptide [Arabidopsis thaliana x Arabidopsis arenosa]|uniref:Neprosin activation peptide n=1 Tax=Arabidopsis thaliana x Arabidopsis arenosa TaxID=1240361 RepID=A0A8T1YAL6_9BRAS|nr:Neprosin activation peptide [Arabidopsis thaliana x Arabidopsis arenosa]